MSATPTGRIEYSAGNPHNPGDPFGRTELVIEPDGTAQLTLIRGTAGHRITWRASIDLAVVTRIHDALATAGFPQVPPHPIPGGATMRELTVVTGTDRRAAMVAWHAAQDLTGYAEAFALLDAITRAVSQDMWRGAPNTLAPDTVRDIARIES